MKPKIVSGVLVMVVVVGLPLRGWAGPPTDAVKRLLDSVRSYKKDPHVLSARDRAANAQAQKVVEETLMIPNLAKQVLGPQWEKLNADQQKDFAQLLMELLEKVAYPKSAEFFGDLRIDYTNEKVSGPEAVV